MWSYDEFEETDGIDEFNERHNVEFNNWGLVLGEDFKARTEQEMYEAYVSWYKRYYSKLGRALR